MRENGPRTVISMPGAAIGEALGEGKGEGVVIGWVDECDCSGNFAGGSQRGGAI